MKSGAPGIVWSMAGAFVGVEAVLALSDLGILPSGLRFEAYRAFAFFDLWFEAARAGERAPLSFYASFFTHAFLHGGFLHLAMNTAVFLALGAHMARAVGEAAMLGLFLATAAAGALAFGLIADTGLAFVPMVGCSGALFGFLGAMKRWEWRYVSAHQLPRKRFWSTMGGLLAVNLLLSVGLSGEGGGVAWEAHLGGFVAGWLAGGLLSPQRGAWIGPI